MIYVVWFVFLFAFALILVSLVNISDEGEVITRFILALFFAGMGTTLAWYYL